MPRVWSACRSSARLPRRNSGRRSRNYAPVSRRGVLLAEAVRGFGGNVCAGVEVVEEIAFTRSDLFGAVGPGDETRSADLPPHRVVDDGGDLFAAQRLAFAQRLRHAVETRAVLRKDLAAAILLVAQDPLDFLVDDA